MNLHDVLNTIIRNRKIIIRVTLIASVLVFLFLFFVYPVSYRSYVTILPPEKNKDLGGLGALLGGQDLPSLITGGNGTVSSQLFVEMLKSRTAAEHVIKKHSLQNYYRTSDLQETADKLKGDLDIELSKEGIIKLSVEVRSSMMPMIFDRLDTLKSFSADISNSYAEALDIINRDKLSSKAKKAREYIEFQLIKTRSDLDSAETSLMEFQKVNKTIALPEQVQAAIDAAATLKTEIIKTEIEEGLMGSNLREDNKNLIALRERLSELRNQYNKMEMGNQDYILAFKEVPALGRQLASLLRDVKIQNEVYLLLQQQYYKEKIQETRDLPTVEILDSAVPPIKASGPRVFFSTAMVGLFVFIIMSIMVSYNEKKFNHFRKKDE